VATMLTPREMFQKIVPVETDVQVPEDVAEAARKFSNLTPGFEIPDCETADAEDELLKKYKRRFRRRKNE
jgi:hypothetical protein